MQGEVYVSVAIEKKRESTEPVQIQRTSVTWLLTMVSPLSSDSITPTIWLKLTTISPERMARRHGLCRLDVSNFESNEMRYGYIITLRNNVRHSKVVDSNVWPAMVGTGSRDRLWYVNGQQHRDPIEGIDQPTSTDWGCSMLWLVRDVEQRDSIDGIEQPTMVDDDGSLYWYMNGEQHRGLVDGNEQPAMISWSGSRYWYKQGTLHRAKGPAIVTADGFQSWYRNGDPIDISSGRYNLDFNGHYAD